MMSYVIELKLILAVLREELVKIPAGKIFEIYNSIEGLTERC